MHYRLLKSEPNKYARSDLIAEGVGMRDGIRNYQARNNLAAMKLWDLCLFYHSNIGKEIVGICQVVKESYPDPTDVDPRRVVVDLTPVAPLTHPVTLAQIKSDPRFADCALIRQSRLSVAPITAHEYEMICELSN